MRGPTLLEDFILREKITHFDHERIPERIVHARGSGAHGYFEMLRTADESSRGIAVRREAGKRTPVFVRFSTVAGERGSTDTARDVRGFAVKFYTDEGNWDLVGNNMPVFFIQDAMKFPDLIHAVKPEPHNAMPQAASAHDTFWDFVSLMPESVHMQMWVMSDRAIPRSYRMMQGFGVHTFRMVNERGASVFVKFHWNPVAGTHSLVWDEAVKISGADPDFHRRDLWEAIEAGAFPEWELGLQIFTEEQAEKFSFDVLDATKIIPEELVPREACRAHGAQPQSGQLLRRDRAGGILHRAHRARTRFQQRSVARRVAFIPIVDTQISAASAGRTSTRFRSMRRGTGPQQPARRHASAGDQPRPCRLRTQLARRRMSVPGGRPRLHVVPAADRRRQGARQAGEVRGSLHTGGFVLQQPVLSGAGPHRGGISLRTNQSANTGRSSSNGRWLAQCRSRSCCQSS